MINTIMYFFNFVMSYDKKLEGLIWIFDKIRRIRDISLSLSIC